MTIIIFIIILAVLILVHELGHFIAARKSGIKVEEFGLGLPPRLFTLFRWQETKFTFNAIPFGGFVKIFGENPDDESISGPEKERSFVHKPKWIQAIVLVAGVAFNVLLAWVLIISGLMMGLPASAGYEGRGEVIDPQVTIALVSPGSPADEAGLTAGDRPVLISAEGEELEVTSPEQIGEFLETHQPEEITLTYLRGEETLTTEIRPEAGVIADDPDRLALGVSMDSIGILKLPLHSAIWEGTVMTFNMTIAVTVGLAMFLYNIVLGTADFSQIAGPVGIVGLVGDASRLGLVYLMQFTAIISIHLAVINLLPFPALDGGRLLFVLIEAIKRSPIKPQVANTLNAIGFLLLILLMILVTYNDILRLL